MSFLETKFEEKSLITFFEENSITVPPIPQEIAELLEERYPLFYATDARELLPNFSTISLSGLDYLLKTEREDASANIKYFGVGLVGYGIQNWRFCYILLSKHVQLIISLPFGNAYDDHQENEEAIQAAYLLIEACLIHAPSDALLRLTLDPTHCEWEIINTEKEVLYQGDTIATLLDSLEKDEEGSIGLENANWIKI